MIDSAPALLEDLMLLDVETGLLAFETELSTGMLVALFEGCLGADALASLIEGVTELGAVAMDEDGSMNDFCLI